MNLEALHKVKCGHFTIELNKGGELLLAPKDKCSQEEIKVPLVEMDR